MKLIGQTVLALFSLGAFAGVGGVIYPKIDPTSLTFLVAVGIPVEDLAFETVVSGYTLRMQYFLPNNASDVTLAYMRPQNITSKASSQEDFNLGSIMRWMVYSGIERALEHMKLPGHSCLLRAICEHAMLPLGHESGLLGELLHILFTPSTSRDYSGSRKHRAYLRAERFGRRGGNCVAAFEGKCKISPLDIITSFF